MKTNHKLIKLSLTVLACAVITACGSSGGGSSSTTEKKVVEKPSTINDTPITTNTSNNASSNNSTNNATNQVTDKATGRITILSGQDGDVKATSKELNNKGISTITVDGKSMRVDFRDLGIYSGSWTNLNGSQICCGTFTDVRFGKLMNSNYDEYLFYNGNPTTAMPTTGTASYEGKMLIAGDTKHFDDEDYLEGTSRFNVDFANKTLQGTLTADTLNPISVDAKISGNDFNGSAKSADFSSQATVDGKFYGNNAKELAGKFMSSSVGQGANSWGGVFGAAK